MTPRSEADLSHRQGWGYYPYMWAQLVRLSCLLLAFWLSAGVLHHCCSVWVPSIGSVSPAGSEILPFLPSPGLWLRYWMKYVPLGGPGAGFSWFPTLLLPNQLLVHKRYFSSGPWQLSFLNNLLHGLCQRLFENPIILKIPFIHTPVDYLVWLQVIKAGFSFVEDMLALFSMRSFLSIWPGSLFFIINSTTWAGLAKGLWSPAPSTLTRAILLQRCSWPFWGAVRWVPHWEDALGGPLRNCFQL